MRGGRVMPRVVRRDVYVHRRTADRDGECSLRLLQIVLTSRAESYFGSMALRYVLHTQSAESVLIYDFYSVVQRERAPSDTIS